MARRRLLCDWRHRRAYAHDLRRKVDNIDEGTLVQKKHPVQTMTKLSEYCTGTGG